MAAKLNSGESFALIAAGGAKTWSWHGSNSEDVEKAYSDKVCGIISKGAMTVVQETSEPADFWEALGGKTEYLNERALGVPPDFEPRLF